MIDIFSESPLSINEACQLLPRGRNSSRPHFATVYRWILDGVKAPDGQLVKLEAVRVGSKWVTSKEALARFIAALTPTGDASPLPVRSPAKRRHADEKAAEALEAKGVS